MKFLYIYTVAGIILSSILIQAAQKRFMLEIYNNTCQNFTKHLKFYKCNYTKVTNGRFLFNTYLMYDSTFGKGVDIRVRIRVTPLNGKTSLNFLDFRTKLCSIFSQDFNNILLRKFANEMIKVSNFPWDCSFKADFLYKVENYSMSDEFLPVYSPYLNATLRFEFLEKSTVMGSYVTEFAVIPRKK